MEETILSSYLVNKKATGEPRWQLLPHWFCWQGYPHMVTTPVPQGWPLPRLLWLAAGANTLAHCGGIWPPEHSLLNETTMLVNVLQQAVRGTSQWMLRGFLQSLMVQTTYRFRSHLKIPCLFCPMFCGKCLELRKPSLRSTQWRSFPMTSTFPQGYRKYSFNSIVFKVSGPLVPIPGTHAPSGTLGKFTCLLNVAMCLHGLITRISS